MECFRLLFEHQFLSGIRDSRKAPSLWGMMRGVGGVSKSIHQSWLATGLGLLCWGFKGVQQEIPWEEASTLKIGSVAFPPTQCTSQQLHPCHRHLTKMCIKTVPHSPYSPDLAPCDFWLFHKHRGCRYETIEEIKEAVTKVIDTLTHDDFHGAFQKFLELYNKCIAAGGSYFEGDKSYMCVLSIKVPIRIKSGSLFNDLRMKFLGDWCPEVVLNIFVNLTIIDLVDGDFSELLGLFVRASLIAQRDAWMASRPAHL